MFNFDAICYSLRAEFEGLGSDEYSAESVFRALLLQWTERLSDHDLECYLETNVAARVFCGFELLGATPDSSSFCIARRRIGFEALAQLFNRVREALLIAGWSIEAFGEVDASELMGKINIWNGNDCRCAGPKIA